MSTNQGSANRRGALLDEFGFEKRWIRWEHPIRIVDARPRRNGDHYLAWVSADRPADGPVRWISLKNFTRFYREHTGRSET